MSRRWALIGVVVLSSALNYLDRLLLAALAPTIQADFRLSAQEYGYLLSAFSLVYACASPAMGLLIDRAGLVRGAAVVVALWSLAGTATAFVGSFAALLVCRAALGLGEAGGVPATGKAFAMYLEPKDRAIGTALNQVGLTIGSSAAPLLAAWCVARGDWRQAFVLAGLLGFLWIPLWVAVTRGTRPVAEAAAGAAGGARELVRDPRFGAMLLANALSMTVYSLWTNWTTVFLVQRFELPATAANAAYAWIPPIAATAGGFAGAWAVRRWITAGAEVAGARVRAAAVGGAIVLAGAAAPFLPSPGLATAAISAALFGVTFQSVNYYAVPLDVFGAGRAAFAVSALTGSFGLMQATVSPLIGAASQSVGWGPAAVLIAVLPLASVPLMRHMLRRVVLRPGTVADLAEVQEIQTAAHGKAAEWEPEHYLEYDFTVAEAAGRIAGFLVSRRTAPDEIEVLNVAVAPGMRRRGVATRLLASVGSEAVFLEVRVSNEGARRLYERLGFTVVGTRRGYYEEPPEDALLMRRDPLSH